MPQDPSHYADWVGAMLEDKGDAAAKVDALLTKPLRAGELLDALARVTGSGDAAPANYTKQRPLRPRGHKW
jgi:hypothetical protein